MKIYERLFKEMAYAGTVNKLRIEVWTDHNPPHFHAVKKDSFDVRISINDVKVISYKWQKRGKEISSNEIKELKKWLNSKSIKNKNITNQEKIIILWNGINPDREM